MTTNSKKIVLFSDVRGLDPAYGTARFMPLSLMAIGTVLLAAGFEPVIIDAQVETNWQKKLATHLPQALFIGVSALSGPSIILVLEAIQIVRANFCEVPIVWGGYHATQAYQNIFEEELADFIVRGPGEEAILDLAEALYFNRPKQVQHIPNVVSRKGDKLVIGKIKPLAEMNNLPPMNYDLIEVEKYYTEERRWLYYISSYGCPWNCTFCAEPTQSSRVWKALSSERVVSELIRLWKRYKPNRIFLADPNFSTDPRRVRKIVQLLIAQKTPIRVFADMRADDILRIAKQMDLKELRKAGFDTIFVGLESGSDNILKAIKKGVTRDQLLEAIRLLDSAGIRSCTSFIHDLPGESKSDIESTFALITELCQLDKNVQSHHFYTPFPATELYRQLVSENRVSKPDKQNAWATQSTFGSSTLILMEVQKSHRQMIISQLLHLNSSYPNNIPQANIPSI